MTIAMFPMQLIRLPMRPTIRAPAKNGFTTDDNNFAANVMNPDKQP